MAIKRRTVSKSVAKWFILAASVLISVTAVSYSILPNGSDPTIHPTIQPTSQGSPTIPEFSSFAVLLIMMIIAVVAVALIYRRKYPI